MMENQFVTDDDRPSYETFVTVTGTTGKTIQIPARWLQINPSQQIVALALKPEHAQGFECPAEGFEAQCLGLLSEQGFIFSAQITNSPILQGWDFDKWADPTLILIAPEVKENNSHV